MRRRHRSRPRSGRPRWNTSWGRRCTARFRNPAGRIPARLFGLVRGLVQLGLFASRRSCRGGRPRWRYRRTATSRVVGLRWFRAGRKPGGRAEALTPLRLCSVAFFVLFAAAAWAGVVPAGFWSAVDNRLFSVGGAVGPGKLQVLEIPLMLLLDVAGHILDRALGRSLLLLFERL